MAYTTMQAMDALDRYLGIEFGQKIMIAGTKNRGFLYELDCGETVVIFVYALVHKQDNTKNYFDTRDSGANERSAAWRYALENQMKYFCLGVNDQVEKYCDFVFSLECSEMEIERISGTRGGTRNGPGNQIIIPNDYRLDKDFERIRNRLGVYISVIHKDFLEDYMEKFDSRPYIAVRETEFVETEFVEMGNDESESPVWNTGFNTEFARNRIVFGAPGTGKSYRLKEDSERLLEETEGSMERVTFHPGYSYAQFVGTYKPVSEGDEIRYQFVPGPFMRVYIDAVMSGRMDFPQPHLLLVEEINRADAAGVFGDVFQLLDRDACGASVYEIQTTEDVRRYLSDRLGGSPDQYSQIRIPDNMFLWATMNSADQGVFPMDTAFKRRWNFEYIGIDDAEEKVSHYIIPVGRDSSRKYVGWNWLRKEINRILAEECKVNEDKLLGPFFLSADVLENARQEEERFLQAFESKVIMYLFEDVMKMRPSGIFKGHRGRMMFSEICRTFEEIGEGVFGISAPGQTEG